MAAVEEFYQQAGVIHGRFNCDVCRMGKQREVMRVTIKSKKWYGRFWPPERRKMQTMQWILDNQMKYIQPKVERKILDELIYGRREL